LETQIDTLGNKSTMDDQKREELKKYRSYSYQEALALVQDELAGMDYGDLTKFCAEQGFTYNTVVSLKNGKLAFEVPTLILQLLAAMDFDIRMTTDTRSVGKGKEGIIKTNSFVIRKVF